MAAKIMAAKFNANAGWLLLAMLCVAAVLITPVRSAADPSGIAGSWSGAGSVVLSNGKAERARCRVQISPYGARSYSLNAVCATQAAKVEQTAKLRTIGKNRYAGSFRNAEYNVSGSIIMQLKGNRISASLTGGGAAAHLTLTR